MMRKFLFAVCFVLISFSASASCKFGINLGDNISKLGDKYGPAEPSLFDGMSFLVVGAEEICPNENLEEIIVEFRFIEDKQVANLGKLLGRKSFGSCYNVSANRTCFNHVSLRVRLVC